MGGGGAPHRGSPSHRGGSPAQEKLSNGGDFWERLHLRLLPHRRNAAPPGAQITRLFRGCLFRLSVSVPRGGGAGVSLHPPPAPRTVSFSTMAPGISGSGFIPQPSVFAAPLLDTGGGQNLRPAPPPGPAAPPTSTTRWALPGCSSAVPSSWVSLGFVPCPNWGGGPHPKGAPGS